MICVYNILAAPWNRVLLFAAKYIDNADKTAADNRKSIFTSAAVDETDKMLEHLIRSRLVDYNAIRMALNLSLLTFTFQLFISAIALCVQTVVYFKHRSNRSQLRLCKIAEGKTARDFLANSHFFFLFYVWDDPRVRVQRKRCEVKSVCVLNQSRLSW